MRNNKEYNLICKFRHSLRTSSNSTDYGGSSNICHCIFVLLAAAALILTAAQAGMALNSNDSLNNAGPIVNATDVFFKTGLINFTANELPMFYLDLDEVNFNPDNDQGESLRIILNEEDEIDNYGIIYTSRVWTDENGRTNIAWLGEKYLAVGQDPSKLAKYLVDFKSYESLALKQGDVWDIGEGLTLTFQDIDVNGQQVWLAFEQDGSRIADIIAYAGTTEYYNDTVGGTSDVTVARIHVDKIFADTNMIIIGEVQIISQSVTELNQDQYFEMDFCSAADYIELTKGSTTLISRGSTVEIIPDLLSIRVGDTQLDEPVRFYVFNEITTSNLHKQHGPLINSTAGAPGFIIFNANELPMFYKDLDAINFNPENNKGESLTINLISVDTIADNGIIYTSRAWTNANGRMNIAWLGENYLAVGDDVTKLTKYVVDFNSSENRTLELYDVWDMGEGFTINFTDIDKINESVLLVLEMDGSPLAELIAIAGETVYYNDTVAGESDVVVARIHVDTVLVDTNMTTIDDVQIISLDVTELDQNEYFGMDFSSTASSIMLTKTDGSTSIERDKTVEIILDFLNIRVSDTLLNRFYVSRVDRDAIPSSPKVTIFAPSSPVSYVMGATRTFKIMVDQTVNVTWYINNTQVKFNENVSEAEYTNTSAAMGTWNVTAVAQNNNGTDMQEWIWMVTPLPIALITEPEEGAYIRETIDIIGTANDTDFKNYIVEWKNSTGDRTKIQISTEPVSDGTLATWDTTDVEDDNYMIKLTVTDNASNLNITIVNVTFDSIPPEVNITEPEQDSPLKFFENFVRGEVSDDNFDSAQLIVKNGTGVIVSSYNLDITDNKFTKRVEFAPDQNNTLELIAVDKANNSNSTNITVIVGNNTYQNTTDVNESEQVVINATYEAGTEIEFYPNVTTDNVTFTVTTITNETQINNLNNSIFTVSGEMAVGKIVEINVTGLNATNESEVQSVTLYLHYTKADLDLNGDGTLGPGDLDEDKLFIYWFNSGNWTKLLKANPDWVIDNGQVKISGDDPGQVWVKVKHLSMFALAALPEPQPTYDGRNDRNGGGGGGGGGASGEDNENIECFEIDRQYVSKDSSVSYNFSNECNTVEHINFTALTTFGTVVGKIEMLKNTSTLVDVAPPDIVFKNFNIWVGYAGWATDQNIEDVTITFVVNKSWVQANNIDTELITLTRYVNSNWIPLQTKQVGEKNDVLIFTASTSPDGFGNFAVTGVEIGGEVDVTTTPVVTSVATPSEMPTTEPTQKSTYKTGLILGVILLLLASCLVYLKKDQISIWLKERRP